MRPFLLERRNSKMSARIEIRDALVIAKKGEDPIRYKVSDRTGKTTASFCVGSKKYDPSYTGGFRFNNFFITVPSDKIEMLKKLKLRRNSLVHVYCSFDYSKDVLAAKEAQGDENSPNYGQSRLVNGVILTLIDIEYAGSGSTTQKDVEEKEINDNTSSYSEEKKETQEPASAVEEKPIIAGGIEQEMGIEIVDLDKNDIFMNCKPKKRKFF